MAVSLKKLSAKKPNIWSWDHSPQVPDHQYFRIVGHWIKGSLLYFFLFTALQLLRYEK